MSEIDKPLLAGISISEPVVLFKAYIKARDRYSDVLFAWYRMPSDSGNLVATQVKVAQHGRTVAKLGHRLLAALEQRVAWYDFAIEQLEEAAGKHMCNLTRICYMKQALDKAGIPFCDICGREIEEGAECDHDGGKWPTVLQMESQQRVAAVTETWMNDPYAEWTTCELCGKETVTVSFCSYCGARLERRLEE